MFKQNSDYTQKNLFGLLNTLPDSVRKKVFKSKAFKFYELIFCNINESNFSILYSNQASRPNSPINCMVAALILLTHKHWTYDKLFESIQFNILTRVSLGLDDLESMPFCPATLFNFQLRLSAYYLETGIDLVEQIFDSLTAGQLKKLGLKTSIQRTDSFLVESNICQYNRLRLLLEVFSRFHRILSDKDKTRFADLFGNYVKDTSEHYVYKLESTQLPHEVQRLGELYQLCLKKFRSAYKNDPAYQNLKRVFKEHFTVAHKKVHVKDTSELTSFSLQSPDDVEITFREKNGQKHRGRVVNAVETAHPDNPIQLLNDVTVKPNNKDDAAILNERLDTIKDKTPDINEIHTDGAFGSAKNDKKMQELGITHIQTAVRGRTSAVKFDIEKLDEDLYRVSCPKQKVNAQKARLRYKACFNSEICATCEHRDYCPTKKLKKCRVYYFKHEDVLRLQRINNYFEIPKERQKIRPNVEATVREFKVGTEKGKLKVRGTFRTNLWAFSTAISINFGRIFRYGKK